LPVWNARAVASESRLLLLQDTDPAPAMTGGRLDLGRAAAAQAETCMFCVEAATAEWLAPHGERIGGLVNAATTHVHAESSSVAAILPSARQAKWSRTLVLRAGRLQVSP
jgi:hypothetical protein